MISNFRLKFGRTPGAAPETIKAEPINIFVGPNNSGKSRALNEIQRICRSGDLEIPSIILDELTLAPLNEQKASQAVDFITTEPLANEILAHSNIFVGSRHGRFQVNRKDFLEMVANPHGNFRDFCRFFLTHFTLMLDGKSRMDILKHQAVGDLQKTAYGCLQLLFRDNEKREEIRRIVFEAFDSYFVIDPTNVGNLRVRLSPHAPTSEIEEKGIHSDAVRFHANAQLIEEASDGVRAFIGILAEVIAGDPRILLIDEPEAFLHPSLASKLGYEISRAAHSAKKKVFVASHSPAFVTGCIQSGVPVNIIRLTYRGGVATARVLPSDKLLAIMRNPLLRSTGVLSGLFYESVVVTEADADRAFYQEINERLLKHKPECGTPNCLFINAQNKQTIPTILKPLRELGIPAAGIVDIDVIKEGGTVFTKLLDSISVPSIEQSSFNDLRRNLKTEMDNTGRDMKKGGISILEADKQEAARNFLQRLGEYGIFTVPGGELESWLKTLGATGHAPEWLINIFEKMKEDPDLPEYVKPADDDVWAFVGKIRAWMTNPNRKGIPA